MKPMRVVIFALACVSAVGCGSKDEAGGKAGVAAKAANDDPNVIKSTAEVFYKDWTTTEHTARMKKYRDKTVEVTGKVFHVLTPSEHNAYTLYVSAGAGKLVVKFKDKGKAATAHNAAKGVDVTINCSPSGMIGKNIVLDRCTLK